MMEIAKETSQKQPKTTNQASVPSEDAARAHLTQIRESYFKGREDYQAEENEETDLISFSEFQQLFKSLKMKVDPEGRVE